MFKAYNNQTGETVAIKMCDVKEEQDFLKNLKAEIDILKEGQCQHLVGFKGSYLYDNELWLVMEFCSGGSVIDLIQVTENTLTEEQIASIIHPVLQALTFLLIIEH